MVAVAFLLFLLFESDADMNRGESAPKPIANTAMATINSTSVKPDRPLSVRVDFLFIFSIRIGSSVIG